jgi:hypothetical protein
MLTPLAIMRRLAGCKLRANRPNGLAKRRVKLAQYLKEQDKKKARTSGAYVNCLYSHGMINGLKYV